MIKIIKKKNCHYLVGTTKSTGRERKEAPKNQSIKKLKTAKNAPSSTLLLLFGESLVWKDWWVSREGLLLEQRDTECASFPSNADFYARFLSQLELHSFPAYKNGTKREKTFFAPLGSSKEKELVGDGCKKSGSGKKKNRGTKKHS